MQTQKQRETETERHRDGERQKQREREREREQTVGNTVKEMTVVLIAHFILRNKLTIQAVAGILQ